VPIHQKTGGFVALPRVRLSILGGIPPDTLQKKTTRSDWRSGFLPRFSFWGAVRQRFVDLESEDMDIELSLASWVRDVLWETEEPINIPGPSAQIIVNYIREEVEEKRHQFPPDIFSALTRLQTTGFRMSAMLAASRHTRPGAIEVKKSDARAVLPILDTLKESTVALFALVGADQESSEEQMVLDTIHSMMGPTLEDLVSQCAISRRKIQRILLSYLDEGSIFCQEVTEGPGRPRKRYFIL
jgi:hypothetical protein